MTPTPPGFARHYDWRHPDPMTRAFELVDDATVVGSLRFVNLVGSRAEGSAFGASWTFHRIGIFRPRIEIRAAGTAEDAPADAVIALDFAGTGTWHGRHSEPLQWTITSPDHGQSWGWALGGEPLMHFEPRPADDGIVAALIQIQGRAMLSAAAAARPDTPLLLMAGWYLMAAQQFDLVANPPVF